LREAVAKLDRAAMAAGGRVTRAMAAGIVAAISGDPREASDNSGGGPSPREPILL
jgi:hypothetical protein